MVKFLFSFLIIFLLINLSSAIADGFYICRTESCAMYVIEDSEGYSWYIECMDGYRASGRTQGAEYGGQCVRLA